MCSFRQIVQRFFASSQASSFLLLLATLLALLIANSAFAPHYHLFWHRHWLHLSLEAWVNDGLMAVFFLLIGLELKRELMVGELSSLNHALLPAIAAIGGMLVPAWMFWQFNQGSPYQAGIGIPMATDIAFALGVLSVLGARVPASLKVFLVTLAVIDDLGAAIMIAVFYAASLSLHYLAAALVVLAALYLFNRLRVWSLTPYLLGGAVMWWLTLQSGVHPTLAGVALAFVIPFSHTHGSLSHMVEKALQWPVAFLILPVFAFANTGLQITPQSLPALFSHSYSFGIIISLLLGKPIGITLAAWLAVLTRICALPSQLRWGHIVGVGMLGGIGFTMSIFITNLAFDGQDAVIQLAKMAILTGSLFSAMAGWLWLKAVLPSSRDDITNL
ncbi:sodium/proton antiporter, NhaA family [Methylophilus rhizosphaerae]|uniref:Na(+)/H(+) antiporter NhaA n=1 Tax=Methylophilus rhizosphaerae TaxID=492660 RepID=A0A1G9ERE8_9PROT|nr:Na+/H+ antiporter NhaA [Methylophilus rhizosphaerae]SDK78643.1 sodium/proton antiporter, NhaA family [Methylophilus rhizosphaerae]